MGTFNTVILLQMSVKLRKVFITSAEDNFQFFYVANKAPLPEKKLVLYMNGLMDNLLPLHYF